jgi:DNA-binding response OmpR family regulator
MVTGKAQPEDKMKGFDAGADDYVTKPFSSTELVARVKAVLRRVTTSLEGMKTVFQTGDLKVDFIRHTVSVGPKEILLTATEHALVFYLARNAGMVLTPDQILNKVWGDGYEGETHLLQVHMARVREKLGDDPKNPRYITTRHGIGYMMARKPAAGATDSPQMTLPELGSESAGK